METRHTGDLTDTNHWVSDNNTFVCVCVCVCVRVCERERERERERVRGQYYKCIIYINMLSFSSGPLLYLLRIIVLTFVKSKVPELCKLFSSTKSVCCNLPVIRLQPELTLLDTRWHYVHRIFVCPAPVQLPRFKFWSVSQKYCKPK